MDLRRTAAMNGIDGRPTARVGDPEHAAGPERSSQTPCDDGLRHQMRENVETHHVVERLRRERQCLSPRGMQGHMRRQAALRGES